MYKKSNKNQMSFLEFHLPFGGKLSKNNRWVQLAVQVPWDDIEEFYSKLFSDNGPPAKDSRIAFGAIYIQQKLALTDEETLQQIVENPYLQYFLGFTEYQITPPFDSSLMVSFRKRFTAEFLHETNEKTFIKERPKKDADDSEPPANEGTLIIDATCTPADIKHPTDLDLGNTAREHLEGMIDTLHQPQKGAEKRPRTYRRKARKSYLQTAKKKRKTKKEIRKAVGQQIHYIARNLQFVDQLIEKHGNERLSNRQRNYLDTIRIFYTQQKTMHDARTHQIENRIVSISQPHVRPIVRGKAKANVEFGAKVSISIVNGYTFTDTLSWDNYNEGARFKESIEQYRRRFGCYPKEVMADKIYRNKENLAFCKENNIRLSGPPLGRPKKDHAEQRRQEVKDIKIRNQVEGKFGEGKRKYGLALIMTKLKETSETVISLNFLVMNFERRLRALFAFFTKWLLEAVFVWKSYPQKFA